MSEFDEMNRKVIDEFRANDGKVGGMFEGAPLVLLHTTGRKTGQQRVNPLMFRGEGERIFIFASKAGAPDNPDWFHNLKANPDVSYELGSETIDAKAVEVTGEERDRIWSDWTSAVEQFAEYDQKTERTIPVVELVRS